MRKTLLAFAALVTFTSVASAADWYNDIYETGPYQVEDVADFPTSVDGGGQHPLTPSELERQLRINRAGTQFGREVERGWQYYRCNAPFLTVAQASRCWSGTWKSGDTDQGTGPIGASSGGSD